MGRTCRKLPHHLPARIERVDIGVESRTSRLPRARSSARLVAALTLISSSPTPTWNPFIIAIISLWIPAGASRAITAR